MEKAVLELAGVRKRYDSLVAVDDLHLSLRTGEFLTLLGPSGSGKTTTLMIVAGLQEPDAGTITLNGASVARQPPYRRDIGMVFQSYALFPHMTVRRNVAFPLEMRGTPASEIARLVDDALALVKLPDHGERLPKQLSGGQQQRVALARAMVYRPALLLMACSTSHPEAGRMLPTDSSAVTPRIGSASSGTKITRPAVTSPMKAISTSPNEYSSTRPFASS